MLGKTIVVNGTTFTVVGITAPNTPMPLGAPDIYLPIGYYPNANGLDRGVRGILVAARLKPGVSIAAAQRDLSNIAKQLEQEYPATNAATGAQVISLKEQMVGGLRESLLIILGAVAVVLLIACANVANLQLARGAARSRELSVRAALGAGRARIAQQLLTESVVLSIIGGVAGMAVAVASDESARHADRSAAPHRRDRHSTRRPRACCSRSAFRLRPGSCSALRPRGRRRARTSTTCFAAA